MTPGGASISERCDCASITSNKAGLTERIRSESLFGVRDEECGIMTTSVCMGIYNGENYIEEQLTSLLRQTRRAEEVILCDDNSTDRTVAIVSGFIETNHLQESWKLFQNRENKGYPGNFYYAMSLCKMEVVFLADQDDIWDEHKIERMCAVLERHPQAYVLACKFGLMDAADKRIHAVMAPSHSLETGRLRQVGLREIFRKYQWPGMVLAYRNGWYGRRRRGLHCTQGGLGLPHDIFLCAMAAEDRGFFQMDEELAYHRRHSNNTAAEEHRVGKLLQKDRKLWEIERYLEMLGEFQEWQVLRTEAGKRTLREKTRAMEGRYEALQSGKIWRVLRAAARDWRQVRVATVVCDLVIVRG